MNVLALDTSTDSGVVILLKDNKIFGRVQKEPREHNRHLLGMIKEVLSDAQLTLNEIDAFACGVGPGSFVGVRLGVAVIQGLSYATNKPVYALSSLSLQAQAIFRITQAKNILIAHDARMQALYLGSYQASAGIIKAVVPEQLIRLPLSTIFKLEKDIEYAGNGLSLLSNAAQTSTIPELQIEDLAAITDAALKQGQSISPEQLQPVYLQDEATWKKLA